VDKLNDSQLISGVVRIIYVTPDEQVRFVEIPIGQMPGGEEAPAPKRK